MIRSLYHWLPEDSRKERGLEQFRSYFKFSFVRNPWDRTVSLYLRREGVQKSKQMDFEDFVDWIRYSSSTCTTAGPHTNQLDWLVGPNGSILVDFIGKFERLEEDWSSVAWHLGVSEELPHRRRNPRRKRHYTEYYNQNTRDIIGKKFSVDIETFGYEFGD